MNRQIQTTLLALVFVLALAAGASAQPFTSGSTGSDGAYNPTVSGDFDPDALGLNPAKDNVFNFTTINIPAGVTIRLRASKVRNKPVIWLATGNVTIAGTLNLKGDDGYSFDANIVAQVIQNRRPAEPGAGGYYGGLGSRSGVGPESGAGPGGGPAGQNVGTNSCYGGFASSYYAPGDVGSGPVQSRGVSVGQTYGNIYLVPIYGGSGGGGSWGSSANAVGGGGGAGGGAIRIVSTTQISLPSGSGITTAGGSGSNIANGGGCVGSAGSGGEIHLIAPTISTQATLNISGGFQCLPFGCFPGGNGLVRLNTASTNAAADNITLLVGPLYNVPPNSATATGAVSITSINGVSVPTPPLAQYLSPDVQINTSNAVTVNIAASNVPVGTVVTLRATAETSGDQSITCTPLAGTVPASTATCTATFPFSISIATLRATW